MEELQIAEKHLNIQHPQPSGKCKSNLLWDSILYRSMVKTNNISDILCWWVEQSSISGSCKNLYKHYGNQYSLSENWELISQGSAIPPMGTYPKVTLSQKHLLRYIQNCYIYNNPKLETTLNFPQIRMDKLNVVLLFPFNIFIMNY